MTAQISDKFTFMGEEYLLIGMTKGCLASPEQFGMEPETLSTACYRGFYASYELTKEALYLQKLTLKEKSNKYLPIGKTQPIIGACQATYHGLREVVCFTGKIRLAKDLIAGQYIHMGYQKPTAFRTVLDIALEGGKVVGITDRSQEIEKKRGAFKKRYESGNNMQTIGEAFSLDMDLE